MDAPALSWNVSISQGEGIATAKAPKEPRNYPPQPPVMAHQWGGWFPKRWFGISHELVVDAPPLSWNVSISQGAGIATAKATNEPRNDPQQPPVMPNRWGR